MSRKSTNKSRPAKPFGVVHPKKHVIRPDVVDFVGGSRYDIRVEGFTTRGGVCMWKRISIILGVTVLVAGVICEGIPKGNRSVQSVYRGNLQE